MTSFGTLTRRGVTALLAAALGAGAFTGAQAQQPPIKIGLTTDLTGIAAAYARGQVNGVELAIAEINAAGGIMGRKLELLVRDSQLRPELGTSHTRDLITREKVDFLIGPDASSVGVAVSAVAKQYKKVVVMTIPNTPRLVGELYHPHFFTIVPSGTMLARAMAEGLDKKYKSIAFIGGDYEASHQAVKYFGDWLAKVNPEAKITNTQWPKLGEPDFTPYITQLLSSKPDLIFSYLWGSDLIAFIKQAKSYGLFERTKFATLLFLDDLRALGSEMPDGILGQMYAPPFGTKGGKMDTFIQAFNAKYNAYPSDWAVMAYDGMMLLAQGIKAANSVDQEAVRTALEGIKYEGLQGGVTTFREVDHQGNVPSFLGVTGKDDKLPFKTLVDIKRIEADKVWPTPQEILAERK
ncbi:ABC transporter substrate-binding protein [Alsobacter metallidurans]|uniref:ABC transporter substrate-binding protein n=1 Tax=Alsobacter metallidurans TaxID=340221 RepID=A0A917IAB6_9HYPH|nr:ABC transporter substrate-binding protein [Alsobacter metallidurans]GGH27878.1 ABC transporter substrate-binding protein [Alsobacter metallidurans]